MGCRTREPQSGLLRLAWDGTHVVVSRTAPGRGAWVHPTRACLEIVVRKKALSRAFRASVAADLDTLLDDCGIR
ncbi:MAG: YlxR family protein [Propionibacteriaceae bacterium]|nr:YlxR family protein [Propionibacteriaceae bacterium]